MATAPATPRVKRQVNTVRQATLEPRQVSDPRTTASPLLLIMLAFLVAFPWLAKLFPHEVRDYIGLLFR
jgi:hypothetical protein